ncbi:MAG TPA: hypothetical protein VL361_16825 [Candidatus Limnocylindrales bacterium]|nr:hypothetical protein [Candidatus Limnocylindrales bacterium]
MKLIRAQDDYLFEFAQREKHMLLQLLKLYPRVPSAHHIVSKSSQLPNQATTQHLLDEALAEQRAENKRRLQTLIEDPNRWTEKNDQYVLRLSTSEMEWLLQVLNDIRVGSWVLLGSPEQWYQTITPQTGPHLWAMELAGAFQMAFLHALEGKPGT